MTKKEPKNNDLKVFQSNNLTLATHNMNSLQKNVVYRILMYCKDDLAQKRNTNMYGEKNIIYFTKAKLIKNTGDLGRLKRDLKDLRERSIILKMPDGTEIITGVILEAIVKPHQDVGIKLSEHFVEFARHCYREFTAFQFKVAFNLKGVHTKRIYEICCMVKNLGKYKFLLMRFREILGVENKYKLQTNFENRILKPAQKRIKECAEAEVSFDYTFERENREVFVVLKIKDKQKRAEIKSIKAKKEREKGTNAHYYLSRLINEEVHNVEQIYLDLNGKLGDFEKKYQGKEQYYVHQLKKPFSEFKKIMLGILKSEFGIDLKNYRYKEKEYKDGEGNVIKEKQTNPEADRKKLLEFYNKNKGNTARNTPPPRLDPKKTIEGVKEANNGQICVKCQTWESKYYTKYRGADYCAKCYEAIQNREAGANAIAAKFMPQIINN